MNPKEIEYLHQWFEKAEHDLITAKLIIELRPLVLDIACFHCQQCVEKYLKAFLLYHGWELIKTHNINFLIEECRLKDVDFLGIELKDLNLFTSDMRYPGDLLTPSINETKEYLVIAEQVKNLVISKVRFE